MPAGGFLDACGFYATAGGTGDFVVSSAAIGYQTPASASAVNGLVYSYRAQSSDLSQWEIGFGAYATGTTTLARTTVVASSTGSKVNFSAPPSVYVTALTADLRKAINAREKLTADRTYYVRTDGNDSNNGLSNTSGGAFLTIQKAIDTVAATLDIAGYTVTIQIADGTYTDAVVLKNVTGFSAAGNLVIQGNNTTPANVLVSVTSKSGFTADGLSSVWDVKDLKITTTTSGECLLSQNGSTIRFGNINFGAAGSHHILAQYGGASVVAISNYTITGGAIAHVEVASGIVYLQSRTVTLTGTPAFSFVFANAWRCGVLIADFMTFSGAATGTRYAATVNGVIVVSGGGSNYFPGSSAGSTATGGQYA